MTITAIREKLQKYIKTADDKKIEAIFTLVESDMDKECSWWEDKELVDEFNNRIDKCISGEEKGSTLAALDAEIEYRKHASIK